MDNITPKHIPSFTSARLSYLYTENLGQTFNFILIQAMCAAQLQGKKYVHLQKTTKKLRVHQIRLIISTYMNGGFAFVKSCTK